MRTKSIFTIISVISLLITTQNVYGLDAIKPQTKPAYKHMQVVGYLEKVKLPHIDVVFKAKMDTGADTSSMNAEVIDLITKKQSEDGKAYVIFTLDTEGSKKTNHIKRPLKRMVRIKMRGENARYQRRPVIDMVFCIAGVLVHEEVNLTNRENFKYDLLVGRNTLAKAGLLIDSDQTFTSKPNCASEEDTAEH
jgi:hypothetical protein